MASPISSLPTSLAGTGIAPADMYSRLATSLVSQNAGIKKLDAEIARDRTRLSGLGQLAGALSDFHAVTEALGGAGLQTAATSSAANVLAAFTAPNAQAGSHSVDVQQLAQGQALVSKALADKNAAIGSGVATTIQIQTGTVAGHAFTPNGSAKTIHLDGSNNSLEGIAKAFAAAGVNAQVVRSGSGYALSIEGGEGAANSLRISVGGDPALQQLLTYQPQGAQGLTQTRAARDAVLTVDGKQVTSARNTVTGAIGGVALALTAPGKTTVTVARNPAQITKNVGLFVSAFNSLADKLKSLAGSALKADATLGQVQGQLAQIVGGPAAQALAKAGVTDRGGKLQLDEKALQAAVASDATGVAKLFTDNGNGLADKLGAQLAQLTASGGTIGKQAANVSHELSTLGDKRATLTAALTRQASAMVQQYSSVGSDASALPGYSGPSSLFDFF